MNNPFGKVATLKAVVWTTGSSYISYMLGLLVSVLVARLLGVDDFGRYSYLVWLSGILVLIANNGLNITAIKYVSEAIGRGSIDDAKSIYGWLGRLQFLCTVGIGVLYVAFLPLVRPHGWEGHPALLVFIVLVSFAFKASSLFDTSAAKGFGRFSIEAITQTVATGVYAIGTVLLALLHASLVAYAIMFAATSVAYALVARWLLRRVGIRRGSPAALDEAWLVRIRPQLFWTAVMISIMALGSRSIETFLLNRWVGAAEVGFFAIATSLTRAGIDLLATGLSTVMMPILSHAFGTGDNDRMHRIFADGTRYYQFLGLLVAGVGIFWAQPIVMIMYGTRYLPVVDVFRILVATSGLLLANGAFAALLSSSDNQRFRVGVTVLSFAMSWIVAITLIPRYGMLGAAFAQAASSILSTTVMVIGIRRFIGIPLPWGLLARQYVAALTAIAIALLFVTLTDGGLIAELTAGCGYALLLLILSIALGAWRNEEIRHVADLIERYPRVARIARRLGFDTAAKRQ